MRICLLRALAIVAMLAPVTVQAQSRIVSPPVEGFFVAHEASNQSQSIREEIPEGETLETWTRMITIQRFANLPTTPMEFAGQMQASVAGSCDEVSMGQPGALTHQGFPAASFSATCYRPANRGGVETFFLMAVQASDALLVMQVAFKEDVSQENMRTAVDLLRRAVVCDKTCSAPTR